MKVTATITIHEIDGKETRVPRPKMDVSNSSNYRAGAVEIEVEGKRYVVDIEELAAAIRVCKECR